MTAAASIRPGPADLSTVVAALCLLLLAFRALAPLF